MSPLEGIWAEAADDHTLFLVAGLIVTTLVVRAAGADRRRLFGIAVLTGFHLALLPVVGFLRARGSNAYADIRLPSLMFAGLAAVSMAGLLLFRVVLPRLRVHLPKILQDVVVGVVSIVVLIGIASRAGFNITGLVATSAVLTAVIGLALQDTLGNIVGGLAVQTDDSINVGDWIRIGDRDGRVTEVRWRYAAIETRDWETIIIPNSQLVKEQVTILGRRGEPRRLRVLAHFNVDFRFYPSTVISVVETALRSSSIAGMADTPVPDCVFTEAQDSYARYAVRYWLTDMEAGPRVKSDVLTRIYFALRRAGIPLSMPAQALFITTETPDRKHLKSKESLARRLDAIDQVEILRSLSEEERLQLSQALKYSPFMAGETLFQQGEHGSCLFLLVSGHVAVRVTSNAGARELARLGPGSFFGEMSLLTGEQRTATVVAVDDVECYRLEKEAFHSVLERRPEVADLLAETLAKRRMELEAAQDHLDFETQRVRLNADKLDLLARIRGFFGMKDGARPLS